MLPVLIGQNPFVFYEGETSLNTSIPFTIRLDGHTFGIDLRNYKRSSLATLRDSIVSTGQVDDSLFNTDGAWWRYRRDWRGGAGQLVMDLGDDRDPRRFHESVGIDVWNEGQLTLLPSTSLATNVLTGSDIKVVASTHHVYILDNTAVYRSSDLSTWTQITVTGTPKDIDTDGIFVYIATSSKLYKIDNTTTTPTQLANKGYDRVWFAGNYLFTSSANSLHTVSSSGTETKILDHFQAGFIWTTIFAVGSKVYAGGYAGNTSELYGFTVSSTGTLVIGAEASQFGHNELLLHAESHTGAVLLCTSKGIRLSTVGADGSITYGPLIDDPGSVSTAFAEGQYVWFAWSSIEANKSGTGRANLSITPGVLQPAYATDVYADISGTVTGVVKFNNRIVFAVSGNGVYKSSTTNYVSSGWLSSGRIHYGSVEEKSITDALVNCEGLAASEKIDVLVTDDSGTEIEEISGNQVGLKTLDVQLNGEKANYFEVKATLYGPGTSTPTFHYWRTRAFPVVPPVEQYIVPLMLFSKTVINDAQGQLYSVDVKDEMEFLIEAWRSKRPLTYIENQMVRRVRLEAYEYSPSEWSDSQLGFEGTFVVRLVTL
jgi:hypothetical protein